LKSARLVQLAAVDDQFGGILKDVGRSLRDVFPVLIAPPSKHTSRSRTARWPASVMYSMAEAASSEPSGSFALFIDMARPRSLVGPFKDALRSTER
jgi:hypothetical protein